MWGSPGPTAAAHAKVEWIEHLGDQNHLHLAVGEHKLVTLVDPEVELVGRRCHRHRPAPAALFRRGWRADQRVGVAWQWIWARICRAELVKAVAATIERHAEELTTLDQAIGDGDHGLNMKRGFEAVLADVANLSAKPWPDFLKGVGTMLVMKVGGASGPLYGTLFMALGKDLPAEPTRADLVRAFRGAIDGGAGARQVGARPEDHARRADPGAPRSWKPASMATGAITLAAACGGRGDHSGQGDARPRLVPRRPLDRAHGSRRAVVRIDDRSRREVLEKA